MFTTTKNNNLEDKIVNITPDGFIFEEKKDFKPNFHPLDLIPAAMIGFTSPIALICFTASDATAVHLVNCWHHLFH